MKNQDTRVCSVCGSADVEMKLWVNSNTFTVTGDTYPESEDCWCNKCGEHTEQISYKEYLDNKKEMEDYEQTISGGL